MHKWNQVFALASVLSASLFVWSVGRGSEASQELDSSDSSLIELYAQDDLLSSYSFRWGTPGGRIQEGELDLSRAQLVFDRFEEGMLSFGFVGNEAANVIDLGDLFVPGLPRASDLAPKFSPSVFHTLGLDGKRVSYLDAGNRVLRLKEGQRIFDPLPREGLYHIEPVIGHTYLMRVEPRGAAEELYKFQVVDLQPGHRVTLRWGRLSRF